MSKNKNHKNQNPAQMTESPDIDVVNEVGNTTSEIKNEEESVEEAVENDTVSPELSQEQKEECPPITGDNSINPNVEDSTPSVVNEEARKNEEEEITTDAEGCNFYIVINTNKEQEFVEKRLSKLGVTVKQQNDSLIVGPFDAYEKARETKRLILGRGFRCEIKNA